MFGIGLPEMIVILAVALIVVGPERLPDMARSVAKWMFELKKTVNQVKQSLAEEEDLLDSVQSDLKKTANDLKGNLIEADDFSWHEPGSPAIPIEEGEKDLLDTEKSLQAGEDERGEGEKGGVEALAGSEEKEERLQEKRREGGGAEDDAPEKPEG
jgi:sec-independent protein translocase protein TatB